MGLWSSVSVFFALVAALLIVFTVPGVSTSKEDTVSMSFKKVAGLKGKDNVHVVKRGEWLYRIVEERYGRSGVDTEKAVKAIRALNPQLGDINLIYPGQNLILPGGDAINGASSEELSAEGGEKKAYKYVVKKGESISGIISKEFKLSQGDMEELMAAVRRLNPHIKDLDHIESGDVILMPRLVGESGPETAAADDTGSVRSEGEKKTPKVSAEGKAAREYIVMRGDSISDIIHDELGASYGEIYKLLEVVRRLNPGIRDMDRIEPGQKLVLPERTKEAKKEEPEESEPEEIEVTDIMSYEDKLDSIESVVGRLEGDLIRDGYFYIPLSESGQMAVDCAKVPVVEFSDGKTILVDLYGRIPEKVRNVIEGTWNSYTFVTFEKRRDIREILRKIIIASKRFNIKKNDPLKLMTVGKAPEVRIFTEWLVSEDMGADENRVTLALSFLDNPSLLYPANIRAYLEKNGIELIEILEDGGVDALMDGQEQQDMVFLSSSDLRGMIESSLAALGFPFLADRKLEVFDIKKDGFDLSIVADLYVTYGGRSVAVKFDKVPGHLIDTLREKGIKVVPVSPEQEKRKALEKILDALDVSFQTKTFKFTFSRWRGEVRGDILLDAVRVRGASEIYYFVDYDVEPYLHGLLRGKWGVNLIRF